MVLADLCWSWEWTRWRIGEHMAKEIGMKKSASAKAKAMDKKLDKAKGIKEGSPADLKMDKALMKKYPAKKAKGKKGGY